MFLVKFQIGSKSVLLIYCSSSKALTKYFLIAAKKNYAWLAVGCLNHIVIALKVKKFYFKCRSRLSSLHVKTLITLHLLKECHFYNLIKHCI